MASSNLDDTFETPRKSRKSKKRKREGQDTSIHSDAVFVTPGKGIEHYMVPLKRSKSRDESNHDEASTSFTDALNDESITTEKKKKKKKKKKHVAPEPESIVSQNSFITASSSLSSQQSTGFGSESPRHEQDYISHETEHKEMKGWQIEDFKTLVEKMKQASMPAAEGDIHGWTNSIGRMKWKETTFKDFTAPDCKAAWEILNKEMSRPKILSEILNEAECFLNSIRAGNLEKPSRPKTAFNLFSHDFWQNDKNKKKYPDPSMAMRSHIASKKFKALSEEKRQKYQKKYDEQMQTFHEKNREFGEKYPSLFRKDKNLNTPRQPSALQIFSNSKFDRLMEKHPKMTKRDALLKLRKRWQELSEEKKIKWIKKTVDAEKEYMEKLQEYRESHPDFKLKVKSVLTKEELIIKDKMDGKPPKPIGSGYTLFCTEIIPTFSDFTSRQNMIEAGRHWRELTDQERDEFNKKAKANVAEYKTKMANYLENLPAEEREKLQQHGPMKMKRKSSLLLYIEKNKGRKTFEFSGLTETEIVRRLVQKYESLPDTEKVLQPNISDDEELKTEQKKITEYFEGGHVKRTKKLFPGEPKKPPRTGYQLFTSELLQSLTDIPVKERMNAVAQRWRNLTKIEQKEYNVKLKDLHIEFEKALKKFKKRLSPNNMSEYEDLLKARSCLKKKRPVKKVKMEKTTYLPPKVQHQELDDLSIEDSDSDHDNSTEDRTEQASDSRSTDTDYEEEISSAQRPRKRQVPDSEGGSTSDLSDDFVEDTVAPKMNQSSSKKRMTVCTPFKPLVSKSSTPLPKKPKVTVQKGSTKGTHELTHKSLSRHKPSILNESDSELGSSSSN